MPRFDITYTVTEVTSCLQSIEASSAEEAIEIWERQNIKNAEIACIQDKDGKEY
jgi:hypothetical protein